MQYICIYTSENIAVRAVKSHLTFNTLKRCNELSGNQNCKYRGSYFPLLVLGTGVMHCLLTIDRNAGEPHFKILIMTWNKLSRAHIYRKNL